MLRVQNISHVSIRKNEIQFINHRTRDWGGGGGGGGRRVGKQLE